MKSEKVYIEYLVLKAQAGEKKSTAQQASDELFVLIQPKIKAFVLKILGNHKGIDDCVQESLLKIFQRINQVRQIKAVHTWFYRIVHSICMDHIRKNPMAVNELVEASDDLNGFEQEIDIKSAIATLSQSQQGIIYLFYYEGFKVAEIAEILDKPTGTIKSLLFDARNQVKSKLKSN